MRRYRFDQQPDTYSDLPEQERPTLNELQDHAEADIVRRGIGRYLLSRDPERSIKMYSHLGMPLLRKAIMGTYGRFAPQGPASNYRTDPRKSIMERSMRFAVGGSVFNEAVHTAAAAWSAEQLVEGHSLTVNAAAVGVNTALVGLQRYNRARMSKRMNEELEAGRTFDPYYKNWLGIDGRAVENYEASLTSEAPEQPEVGQVHPVDIPGMPVNSRPVTGPPVQH